MSAFFVKILKSVSSLEISVFFVYILREYNTIILERESKIEIHCKVTGIPIITTGIHTGNMLDIQVSSFHT